MEFRSSKSCVGILATICFWMLIYLPVFLFLIRKLINHACTRWGLGVGHAGTALGRAHPYLADVDRLRFGVPVREGCEHDTCCDRIGEPEVPLKNENRERTHVLSGRVDVGHEGRAVDYVAAGPWSFTAAWHMRTVPSDDAYVQVSPSASGPTHPSCWYGFLA